MCFLNYLGIIINVSTYNAAINSRQSKNQSAATADDIISLFFRLFFPIFPSLKMRTRLL
jgi:hypothetical protein